MAITSEIVVVNAQVTQAPAPSTLQQAGALVSVGGTTISAGTYLYCANLAAVTAILSSTGNFAEISDMAGTYFGQGTSNGVYVLELGASGGVAATQITSLGTWIAANNSPQLIYAYLLPAGWDTASSAAVNTMSTPFSSPTSRTYFFPTTTSAHLSAYTQKSFICTVPSPTAAGTEFQAATLFYQWLVNTPSLAAPVPPMNYRFVFGVTPWAQNGTNQATIDTILTAFGNVISTGAEGGVSRALIRNGTTMDGNQAIFWYAFDWLQINAKLGLANAAINGSNSNPPLYYNQFGINYLLKVLQSICNTGISFGLLLSATPSAISFATYVAANPTDYAAGLYKGFSVACTPQLGFTQITFFVDATSFAA